MSYRVGGTGGAGGCYIVVREYRLEVSIYCVVVLSENRSSIFSG